MGHAGQELTSQSWRQRTQPETHLLDCGGWRYTIDLAGRGCSQKLTYGKQRAGPMPLSWLTGSTVPGLPAGHTLSRTHTTGLAGRECRPRIPCWMRGAQINSTVLEAANSARNSPEGPQGWGDVVGLVGRGTFQESREGCLETMRWAGRRGMHSWTHRSPHPGRMESRCL